MKILTTIILTILALVFLFFSFFFVVGIIHLAFQALFVLLVVGAILFFCFPNLFKRIGGFFKQKPPPSEKEEVRLWESGGQVRIYLVKPSLAELTGAKQISGQVLSVPNETPISVLEDQGDVIKIKVAAGDNKGKVVWVDRTAVLGYKRALPGN